MTLPGRKYLLRIMNGLHAGASHVITEGVRVRIGNNLGVCDITLFDEGVASEHLDIVVESEYLNCHTIAPNVSINKKILTQVHKYLLAIDTLISLGGVTICISAAEEKVSIEKIKKNKSLNLILSTLIIISSVLVAWLYFNPILINNNKNIDIHKKFLENRLIELGILPKVIIEGSDLVVYGIFNTISEINSFEKAALTMTPVPKLRVELGSEIADKIQKEFLLSGYDITSEYKKYGVVIVTGFSGTVAQANRLRLTIGQSFPLLRDIQIVERLDQKAENSYISLPPASGTDFNILPELLLNKRIITAALDGPNAHILMNDNSHYFLGAEMPSGGTLHNINSNGVLIILKNKLIQYPL